MFGDLDVEVVQADVLDADSLRRGCEDMEAVVHMVAVVRETGGMTFQQVNYGGSVSLLRAAEAAGVRRFVHASTIGASSDPAVPYLYSRWMAEQEIERSPMASTVLRFSVGFGEGDEFFNVLAALVKASPVVPIAGDGSAEVPAHRGGRRGQVPGGRRRRRRQVWPGVGAWRPHASHLRRDDRHHRRDAGRKDSQGPRSPRGLRARRQRDGGPHAQTSGH